MYLNPSVFLLSPDERVLPEKIRAEYAQHPIRKPQTLLLESTLLTDPCVACTVHPGQTCEHGYFCTSDWFHPRLQERRAALKPPPAPVPAPLTIEVLDEDDGDPE